MMYYRINIFKFFIVFIFLIGFIVNGYSNEAKDILARVATVNKMRDFSAIQIDKNGLKSHLIQHIAPDGCVYSKIESMAPSDKISKVYIQNEKGQFFLVGHKAIKLDFINNYNKEKQIELIAMAPTELVNAELLLIDKKYNDIDCFLITQIFSLKEDALKLIYGALPLEVQKVLEVDTFYTLLPKKIEYYIGKDDYFIYDYATYNVEGKMLTRRSFLSVDFSQTFSPEEFDIPQDYEILTPYSISELSNVISQAIIEERKLFAVNDATLNANVKNIVLLKKYFVVIIISLFISALGLILFRYWHKHNEMKN